MVRTDGLKQITGEPRGGLRLRAGRQGVDVHHFLSMRGTFPRLIASVGRSMVHRGSVFLLRTAREIYSSSIALEAKDVLLFPLVPLQFESDGRA